MKPGLQAHIHQSHEPLTPEKNLWKAVLNKYLIDFILSLNKSITAKHTASRVAAQRDVQSLLRMIDSEHFEFILGVCEVHKDTVKSYMTEKIKENKPIFVDFRFHNFELKLTFKKQSVIQD